jgi:hypothetical protein
MKTIKTQIPEGWEIDKEKSTFEEIVLKQIKKELPKRWEDLGAIKGYYSDGVSGVYKYIGSANMSNQNTFTTEAQAKASIALAQLSQLREVYRGGWKPELSNGYKCIIQCVSGKLSEGVVVNTSYFLSFQSEQVAKEFLSNFRELIIESAPLLFGEEIK